MRATVHILSLWEYLPVEQRRKNRDRTYWKIFCISLREVTVQITIPLEILAVFSTNLTIVVWQLQRPQTAQWLPTQSPTSPRSSKTSTAIILGVLSPAKKDPRKTVRALKIQMKDCQNLTKIRTILRPPNRKPRNFWKDNSTCHLVASSTKTSTSWSTAINLFKAPSRMKERPIKKKIKIDIK